MKVLITGANGFVGAAVVDRLRQDFELTLMAGPRGAIPELHRDLRWIQRDLCGSESLKPVLRGQDAIIHLAGLAHVSRNGPGDTWERFQTINVNATERLAQAAAREGVQRFVLMSSGAINGVRTYDRPFTEADPANPSSHYGLSKQRAEEALQNACASSDMAWVSLRPPVLVGRNTPGNIATVMKAIDRRLPLPFGAIRNRRSYLGLRNFADFVALAAHHPAAANQTFMLTDAPSLSTPELIAALAVSMGRSPNLFSVPVGLIKAGALASGRTSSLKPLWATLELDASKAVSLLGWAREQPLQEAFSEAATSFRTTAAGSAR
jgi:nucleoside-diphosphate-sugar epimerase